ncbi:MAG: glycosyltransferase [bacterium]
MKNNPFVSIITPSYNHEKYIKTCIESVLYQTYTNWEQIIVDDGSNDKTEEIIKSYKNSRIQYIKQQHLGIWGLAKTYNKAINNSKGEFIAILEGDDFWPKNKLEIQLPYCYDNNVAICWGKGEIVNEEGKIISNIMPKDFYRYKKTYLNDPVGIALNKLLFENFLIPTATILVRKKFLLEIGGFKQPPYVPYTDYPTWLEIALKGKFSFVNEVLGYWRYHPCQSTIKLYKEQWDSHTQIALEFCTKLPSDFKKSMGIKDKSIESRKYWVKGRINLINKEWNQARKNLFKAILMGTPSIKLKSMMGIINSFCHMDLEHFNRVRLIKIK